MQKGIKLRIYPNKSQQELIDRTFGCCRLIYNKGLALREENHKQGAISNYIVTNSMLTELKKQDDYAFLKEVDSMALQQSLRDLDRAYTNLFKSRAEHPTFKSKHNKRQSYRTLNQGNNIRIAGKYLKLPKIGYVKFKQKSFEGDINNVTVERTPTGKYFAVLNVNFEPEKIESNSNSIGIDVGIRRFYADSNGRTVENPKHLEKAMRKLKREQRRLSRKKNGSSNRNKQRKKVAQVYEKVTNQRNDFLHKQSTMLVRENQTICIEDLNIKSMLTENRHKFAKYISSASWGKFFNMLNYKAEWYGRELIKVPRNFPSTQTCSNCGNVYSPAEELSVHKWTCPYCGAYHDRDINAAINILHEGLRLKSA